MQNTIKQINLDEDFDKKIISGVEKLFQVVSKTFGPNGRTIVLKQKDKLPIVTKDGYTVAKFFDLEDPIESIGADFIRKAAEKTAKVAGDGTSSTSILSYFLLKAAFFTCFNACKYLELILEVFILPLENKLSPL